MKSYNGLFDTMLSDECMDKAFLDASKGKRGRKDVLRVFKNYNECKAELAEMLDSERFRPAKHKPCIINEANCQKEREIVKPFFRYEQVVHHLVVGQLKGIILKGFYEYSCGSIPERGCHYGKKHMERWIKRYEGKELYVLKMDIRHFFENVDHDILKRKLSEVVRDQKFLRLCNLIIDANEQGIPLGYYTSQWFANFYLKSFDHYVKEDLRANEYMRYMDDMVILDESKERLHEIRHCVEEYLSSELNVELKGNYQVFPLAVDSKDRGGRALDFMGFKFYRNTVTLRKSILFRARRKANRIGRKIRATWYDAVAMISYHGWFKHTHTFLYFICNIETQVHFGTLRSRVSNHSKKEVKKNAGLEIGKGVTELRAA